MELWREVLRVDQIGVRDKFFGSGGDSLMSSRYSRRCRTNKPSVVQYAAELMSVATTEFGSKIVAAMYRTVPVFRSLK